MNLFKKWLLKILICERGGGKTEIQQAPTTPAPSASETAGDIYKARLQFDPLVAQQEMDIQQQFAPQQADLYNALYQQFAPGLAQTATNIQQQQMPQLQALQAQLFPQQSQIIEAGAGQALQGLQSPALGQLQQAAQQSALGQVQQPQSPLLQALGQQAQAGLTPTGISPEQQSAIDAIRGRQVGRTQEAIRTQANLGGGLFGGRAGRREQEAVTQMGQGFAQEDVNRLLAQRQQALASAGGAVSLQQGAQQNALMNALAQQQQTQQAANPFINILYPNAASPQPQISPFQFQSAVPSANNLYNAFFQASQPQQFATQTPDYFGSAMGALGSLGGGFLAGR